jgi:hypothetical protein
MIKPEIWKPDRSLSPISKTIEFFETLLKRFILSCHSSQEELWARIERKKRQLHIIVASWP